MNKGAKGKFLYLNYRRAGKNEAPLTEIGGYYGEQNTLPAGWEWPKDNKDLNKGSGGEFIWLAVKH